MVSNARKKGEVLHGVSGTNNSRKAFQACRLRATVEFFSRDEPQSSSRYFFSGSAWNLCARKPPLDVSRAGKAPHMETGCCLQQIAHSSPGAFPARRTWIRGFGLSQVSFRNVSCFPHLYIKHLTGTGIENASQRTTRDCVAPIEGCFGPLGCRAGGEEASTPSNSKSASKREIRGF